MTYRDPSVYIILSLDTNLEVTYSTTHLFGEDGLITSSRVCHGDHERMPFDELENCMDWGANALSGYQSSLFSADA